MNFEKNVDKTRNIMVKYMALMCKKIGGELESANNKPISKKR